jgi:hypothetical protein
MGNKFSSNTEDLGRHAHCIDRVYKVFTINLECKLETGELSERDHSNATKIKEEL